MKKKIAILPLLTLALGTISLSACGPDNPPVVEDVHVESIVVTPETLAIEVGGSANLTAVVTPANATDSTYTWSVDDPTVASVSSLGKVTGLKEGTATVTATTTDGGKTDTCSVTVSAAGAKYGSADNPLTVAEALALANEECATSGSFSAEEIYVQGIVTRKPTLKTGDSGPYMQNVYVADSDDASANSLLIYTINYVGENPWQHDTILAHGFLTNYSGTMELSNKGTQYPQLDEVITRGSSTITYVYEEEQVTMGNSNPTTGINESEISFEVEAKEGFKIDSVAVDGNAVTAEQDGKTYKATVRGDMKVEIGSSEAGVEMLTAVAKYEGTETVNMFANVNNAESIGLDPSIFTVNADNKGSGALCGLNKDGSIRLYNKYSADADSDGDGGELIISSKKVTIKQISLAYAGTTKTAADGAETTIYADSVAEENAVAGENDVYKMETGTVIIKNTSKVRVSCQIHFSSITIKYVTNEAVHATSIAVEPSTVELKEGQTALIAATVEPSNANDAVLWTSSDEEKVTVTDGMIKGVAAGTATVTAFADSNENGELDEGEAKAEVAVTVKAVKNYANVELPEVGKTYKLGVYQGNLKSKFFATGKMSGNYGEIVTDPEEGADAEIVLKEGTTDEYFVKLTVGESTLYMNEVISVSGSKTYVNVSFGETAKTAYKLSYVKNEVTYYGFFHEMTEDDLVEGCNVAAGTVYVMGSYNTNKNISPSTVQYLETEFCLQMYEEIPVTGSLSHPLTVGEALDYLAIVCPNSNDVTPEMLFVRGIVQNKPTVNGSYGWRNVYLGDENGADAANQLLAYDLNKNGDIEAPAKYDTIIVKGYVKNYSGTLEFAGAKPAGASSSVYPTIQSNVRGEGTVSVSNEIENATVSELSKETGTNGSTFTFKVTPAEGFEIASVTVDDVVVEANDGVYTGTIAGDTVIMVTVKEAGAVDNSITVTKTIAEIQKVEKWANGTVVTSIELDDVITVSATKGGQNDPKYYDSGSNWRIYKDGGSLTFTAAEGYVILSVTVTFDSNLTGLTNNKPCEVNASTITFTATGTAKITALSVTYEAVA